MKLKCYLVILSLVTGTTLTSSAKVAVPIIISPNRMVEGSHES